MDNAIDSFATNRENWDERAPIHAAASSYAVAQFLSDPEFLSDVVRFDRDQLGDLTGLRALHLQCHIGTDTLSLARLGATATGLDFSAASLHEARLLADAAGEAIHYVESNVYDAPSALKHGQFDLVYTGIGALCWLPSIERWAEVVAELLAPGGRLFLREAHPMLYTIDEERLDDLVVTYPYFETQDPVVWVDSSTYADPAAHISAATTHEWNHGIGEVISALLGQGLTLTSFVEHQSVPWEALPGRMTLRDDGEYVVNDHPGRLPLTYTLTAERRN
ncbi:MULTISPECIES: bifunctional 2-polyprenyl-6-hydroxyphenol methylase/3-demethylubiquinol 3-O-methyltransferase UbiG [unclassified Leucobacter]|uniref:class I SAM-dependent methyltransferase n=1 Tax=unclassified Leucobacter TaxID=2621730 RepID=UPI00165EAFF2|nr:MULTISPECIES: class I SAM-dependent methyltransferase [unclassified Leucobacter]MBC9935439.1 class I SAM-dependent methyltransferase [Leucobacter sp. cx-87]